jgi:hypothetical protein
MKVVNGMGSRRIVGGEIEPFPTMSLLVSGRKRRTSARPEAVTIVRNQNIHVHPAA